MSELTSPQGAAGSRPAEPASARLPRVALTSPQGAADSRPAKPAFARLLRVAVPDVATLHRLATLLAPSLRAGDLVVLAGDLGAGKTTFTQGLARALGIADPVTSPTFVIARAYPPAADRPGLVHVDAYRVGSTLELDDLDLDSELATSVAVVEWGEGRAESLADERLVIRILRSDDADDETRTVVLEPVGDRWQRIADDVTRAFAGSAVDVIRAHSDGAS